jgi:PAS domain S-box-containing protein
LKTNKLFLTCVGGSLGLATILLGVTGYAGIRALDEQHRGFQLVTETYVVKEAIAAISIDIRTLRVAQRTYVEISGVDALMQYDVAYERLRDDLDRLWAIPQSPEQVNRITRLTGLLGERHDVYRGIVNLNAAGDREGALREMNDSRGAGQLTAVTRLIDEITSVEDDSLTDKIATTVDANAQAKTLILTGLALSIVVIVFCGGFIFRDLRRRFAAERAMRASAQKLQDAVGFQHALVNSAAYAIIATDARGTVTDFNRTAELMLGFTADEVVGRATADMFYDPTELQQRAAEITQGTSFVVEPGFQVLAHFPRGGQVEEREWTYRGKGGIRLSVHVSMTAIRGDGGQISGYLGIARDITEGRKVERLKNEFVSTVSHELRTPLTSIRGSLGLVLGALGGELSGQVKGLLQIAHNNADRLSRLINDILDVEKIESGKMEFKLQSQPLLPLLQQSIDGVKEFATQFNVTIALMDNAHGVEIETDSDRFIQIMVNLLSNAAKFSPSNESIMVRAERHGRMVRVSVSDKGKGIPVQFQNRIFEKFAQADSSDTRAKSGTGLGLSITKAIVEKMNGSIGFDTQSNVGTTFYVDFPESAGGATRRTQWGERLRNAG